MIVRLATSVLFAVLLLGLGACSSDSGSTLFTSVPSSRSGVKFKNTLQESEEFNVLNYGYFYNGGGVAVGDINNDGLPDIYITGNMKASKLYLNKGDWKFEEIAQSAGVEAAGLWNTGTTMADVNNDGWLDIYVCRSAAALAPRRRNLLFINNRNNTFTEMAYEFGLDDSGYSTQAVFFDYDQDGDLDMYLLNHSVQEYAGFNRFLKSHKDRTNPAYGDKLYKNNLIPAEKESIGRFLDVSVQAGIKNNVLGFGLGVAVEDLNNDGWLDIYVSNDYNEEDYCYINQKNGTFKETIRDHFDHTSLFSMGSDVADINNDGLPEVYTLDMLPESNYRQKMTSGSDNYEKKQALYENDFHYQSMRNMLHLNNGDGSFSEIGQLAGVSNTDWSWAALFADFDNDGWKDLFVSNGYKSDYTNMDFMAYAADQQIKSNQTGQNTAVADLLGKIPSIEVPNYIYKNNGDLTFSDKTQEWGLDQPSLSNGSAYADFDNDGDLDLLVNNVNAEVSLYRNNAEQLTGHNYLKVQLWGCPLNRLCYGTKVYLKNDGQKQMQTLIPSRGFQSAVEPILHFGLGQMDQIQEIEVVWPDGNIQTLAQVTANQTLKITYDSTALKPSINPQVDQPLFKKYASNDLISFVHQENSYNDFKQQPLLPHMLSTQGPRACQGDVNGDGRTDLYVGGAKGQAGQLFLQTPEGKFAPSDQPAFSQHQLSEDLESLFFDADGDEDLDLYVCSGGNEAPINSKDYQDRLYINDGSGSFSDSNHLPEFLESSSCVAATDWDGDGDLDLFVGGRLSSGNYPQAASSYLLENDGTGHFQNRTSELAPALSNIGMVCDAIWTDYDQDQDADLILVGEWMPITVFKNNQGQFERQDQLLPQSNGWWNTIAAKDMDADGDIDFVVGNYGYNSQMHASVTEPVQIYIKDFDNNGTVDPILTYFLDGESWPMAPKDDLIGQLPSLRKNFLHYEDYAKAKIDDLFTPDELQQAEKLQAFTFATSYVENQGNGQFSLQSLPLAAQLSPTYSIQTHDFNQDGHLDILLGGNFLEARVQFGHYDANKGTLLLGDGKGNFNIMKGNKTGLALRGGVRDMELISNENGKNYLLVLRNDASIQAFELSKE